MTWPASEHTLSFTVPLGYYYNRHPNPYTGIAGDATFPRHIFLTSYSLRLGKGITASDQPPPSGPPSTPSGAPPGADGTQTPETSPDPGAASPPVDTRGGCSYVA